MTDLMKQVQDQIDLTDDLAKALIMCFETPFHESTLVEYKFCKDVINRYKVLKE